MLPGTPRNVARWDLWARAVRPRGRAAIYLVGGSVAAILLALGLLLVNFIADAAQIHVQSQTAAGASSTAMATRAAIADDLALARIVRGEVGITTALLGVASSATVDLLTNTNFNLLTANPRVRGFYFFASDSSYSLGQTIDPVSHRPTQDEQPPDWYDTANRMRETLHAVLSGAAGPIVLLTFDRADNPYGALQIFQSIPAVDGRTIAGAVAVEIAGSSVFAPYIQPVGSSGNLFLVGNAIIGPRSAELQARGRLPVIAPDPRLDNSITGGLRQFPTGSGLGGAYPQFRIGGNEVLGTTLTLSDMVINGSPLRVVSYASSATIGAATKRVLAVVVAFVLLLVLGVGGLLLYLHRRLEQGEHELARNIQARNEALTVANRKLEVIATTDPLTELPNRLLLQGRMEQALRLARGRGGSGRLALLLLDLDRFKEVNDTLGHECGDLLLQQVSSRLCAPLSASDTVARLGGDEFAFLLPGAGLAAANAMASALHAALDPSFVVEEQPLEVSASIGIALYPDHGADPTMLLRCADVAMYVAKRGHAGLAVYSPDQDQHSPHRLALMSELRQAIAQDTLLLYYQPKVGLGAARPPAAEALLRWQHPEHGFVGPDYFVPLAEHTGLIGPLTLWVLRAALRQWAAWQQAGLRFDLSVNLSMRSFGDGDLPARIAALLEHYRMPPGRLTLEITESALMADPDRALDVVTRLGQSGVRVAIDDFGTGYSSLGYLKRLPVHEVKLDKSFVTGLDSRADNRDVAIVRSVIALAQALQREVVAEGVEDQAGLEVLRALGCDIAQGYYIGRPMPAADLEHWLHHSPWASAARA